MGGPVLHGHAVNARRSPVGLHPFPRPRQVVAGQHRLQQVFSDCFVLSQGSVRAGRRAHLARSGLVDAFEVGNVCSLCLCCSALQRPDSRPPTTASADFCAVTSRVAACRAVRFDGGCCLFIARSGQLAAALGSWCPGVNHPGFATIDAHRSRCRSPQVRDANCRCTSAAFTVGCVPLGFAVMCQLASQPSALYAVSVRRLAPLALGLPPDNTSRSCPCRRLVVILAHDESKSVLPQGTCTP